MVNKANRKWLEQEFGDYMVIPPTERRKVHPEVKICFAKTEIAGLIGIKQIYF